MKRLPALLIVVALWFCGPALAENNIDLSTIQPREGVQLTIYNAEDLTLVRETRTVTFREGDNPLQFSWSGTLIDPTSVELRFLDHAEALTLVDTTFPHDKPQQLEWHVRSDTTTRATVEVSYFTSGVTWSADYAAIVSPDEATLDLQGFVTVQNQSGEDYEAAEVRLVVGTINLVEQIAKLARQPFRSDMDMDAVQDKLGDRRARDLRLEAAGVMMARAAAPAAEADAAPEIKKEGLSEYFIFTIEGDHDLPNRFRQRLRSFEPAAAELDVEYRYRPQQYGDRLVRMLLITNDTDSDLGESPLPDGVTRVFQRTAADGLTYLGRQSIPYVPIGEAVELNLGEDPRVAFEYEPLHAFRTDIWADFRNRVRRRIDDGGFRIRDAGRVVGWDEHVVADRVIRNFTERPIRVAVRRPVPGDARFLTEAVDAGNFDARTVAYAIDVEAGETHRLRHEIVTARGENAEQSRVRVEKDRPAAVPWLQ